MNIKEMIKLLINVEIDTEDLTLLKEDPEKYTATKMDAWKLKQLFLLFDSIKEMEDSL